MSHRISLYLHWWKTWKTLPVRSWVKGAAAYRASNFIEAERHYIKGLESHPHHPARYSARLDLAFCLFKNGKFLAAEEQLQQVTTFCPEFREAYVRLSQLQLWIGHSSEAAWSVRRAIQKIGIDPELVGLLLLAVLDSGGPVYLMQEAVKLAHQMEAEKRTHPILETALARLHIVTGEGERDSAHLARIASSSSASLEAIVLYAETLLEEERVPVAQQYLRRALMIRPDHPRVLSLMAHSYLRAGESYNPPYAVQLAVTSCQGTGWSSPREMHILAEAYYRSGDKVAALVVASRAKLAGNRPWGTYRYAKNLEKLIESLSSGTQA